MELKLLTPNEVVFSGEITYFGGRTPEGAFGMLPRHIPAFMKLEPSKLAVKSTEGDKQFLVPGGFLFKERDDTLTVLTREAKSFEGVELAELENRIDDLQGQLEDLKESEGSAEYRRLASELDRAKLTARLVKNE